MKIHTSFLIVLLGIVTSFAQAPEKFSFQGVARSAVGKLVVGQDVSIRVSIRPETALGNPIYQETHSAKTNANGVFNIEVGGGEGLSGQFSTIDWKSGKYFLQLEMDVEGGINYIDLGATQLLSVPYALHTAEAGRWKNYEPVVQEGKFDSGGYLPALSWETADTRFMWYPRRAAFRFGGWNGSSIWSDTNIGAFSFAGGMDAIASGDFSFAYGRNVKTTGKDAMSVGLYSEAATQSVALGAYVDALGDNSVAIGHDVQSSNSKSIAMGYNLKSRSQYGIVFGIGNDISDAIADGLSPTQRLFQLGNGEEGAPGARRNAVTILLNGNVGIGNNVLAPTHILDVGHRMRLRSNPNGMTAGLWLDDAGGAQYSFIGGFDDDQAGIYFEDHGWVFTVNKNGTAKVANALVQTSDLRLKRDIIPLTKSFEKLSSISGRNYYWKDKMKSQSLQTGLIAQEVEAVFPELVDTDKDGFKSVNYIGLIPHLLEAVKELKQENTRLSGENEKLAANAKEVSALQKRLEAIEASLAKDPAVSVK